MSASRYACEAPIGEEPLFILQHVWSRWTKATRAGADAGPRLSLPEAYPLQLPPPDCRTPWLHDIHAFEETGFQPVERAGELTREAWEHATPMHAANLHWRERGEEVELSLTRPWGETMLRTAWPQHLPSPVSVARPGASVRIDWNARFAASAGGSDRSFFYEHHTFWAAVCDAPERAIFLAQPPRKHIDLRTRIY